MSFIKVVSLTAVLSAAAVLPAAADVTLGVNHGWSSPSEMAAIKVLQDHLAADGIKWKDVQVVAHDTGANISIINMIAGGNPPDVFMASGFDPGLLKDLKSKGYGVSLTDLYNKSGAVQHFPPAVLKSITLDGEIVKAPVNVHIDGMLYYNLAVAKAAGVDPKSWKSLDDMFADYDKVQKAGYIPLAIGGEKWQIGYLFQALMAAVSGNDIFDKFYAGKPDPATFDSPAMHATLAMLRKFQQHTDPGSPNRKWNDTTNLVITGKALMQIHGDWMKGEFRAAGKQLGKDFDCTNIPGTKGVVVTVDSWSFIKSKDPAVTDAQQKFAELVVDPKVSADFSSKKGSSPVVDNAPTSDLDACNQIVLNTLKDPNMQHQNPHNTADADWLDATWDVADKFWGDPSETEDQAIGALHKAYDSIY
jgi:glucose/mannose transport system substrate-binding protein